MPVALGQPRQQLPTAAGSEIAGHLGQRQAWEHGRTLGKPSPACRGDAARLQQATQKHKILGGPRGAKAAGSEQQTALCTHKSPDLVVLLLTHRSNTARAFLPSQSPAVLLQPAQMRLTVWMENYFKNITSIETIGLDQALFLSAQAPHQQHCCQQSRGRPGAMQSGAAGQPGKRQISSLPQIPEALLCPEDAVIHSAKTPGFFAPIRLVQLSLFLTKV